MLSKLEGVRTTPNGWQARCPAHEDDDPSLSIAVGDDGRVLLDCKAKCRTDPDVVGAMGIAMRDLFPRRNGNGASSLGVEVEVYPYTDAAGKPLFEVVRFQPKDFRQRLPDGRWGLHGTKPVLYRLPTVRKTAKQGGTVFVVEGERDVHTLERLGFVATTNPMGSGKWKPEYSESLRGGRIIVLPDNDPPGRKHAEQVARSLWGIAAAIKVVELPGLPPKGDVSDWLRNRTKAELVGLVKATKEWTPPPERGPASEATKETQPEESLPVGFSEDELALKFTRRHREDLRYVDEWKRWHSWDGTRWRRDRILSVLDRSRLICRENSEFIERDNQKNRVRSAQTVAAVVRLAAADPAHARVTEDFDSDPLLLNTPDGTVDLRTGELREHRREDGITKCTAVSPRGECPLWNAALRCWTAGDSQLAGFLQRLMGYSLTGTTLEEIFVFFYGTGGNGKGSFLNTFTYALGDYAAVAPMETFTESKTERHPTDIAMLRGARFVVAQETRSGRRWDEKKLKDLTGGDPLTARFMRGDFFTYVSQFKLIVAGNHKPGLRNVDEVIRRRLRLVPFTVTISDEERAAIPDFKEKLKAEAPGILAWATRGCLDWQAAGLRAPDSVMAATEAYFQAQDTVSRWLEDRCILEPSATATKAALYADWKRWTEENGEYVLPQRLLLERLEELYDLDDARMGKNRDRALIGIGLRGTE